MLQAILFCLALCTDAFVASIAYGADDVCIMGRTMSALTGNRWGS